MNLEPNAFPTASSASVFVDAGALGDDENNSPISGTLTVELLPSAVNPTTAEVIDLSLQVDDAVRFVVGGTFLLPRISAGAEAGAIKVNLVEHGTAGQIDNDEFTQLDNSIGLEGVVSVSTEPEPIDLAQKVPTPLDLENVSIVTTRETVVLEFGISTEFSVPIEAGFVTFDVLFGVDANINAVSEVPAADYIWKTDQADTQFEYADSQNWRRGDLADTGSIPSAADHATFVGGSQPRTLTLADERTVREASVDGEFNFVEGTLKLAGTSGNSRLTIDSLAAMKLEATSTLQSDNVISVSGGGSLIVDGSASALHLVEGTIGGIGTVERLSIGPAADLRVDSNTLLTVSSELEIDGDLVVSTDRQVGSFTIVMAGQINASDVRRVVVDENELPSVDNGRFAQHQGGGFFTDVLIGDTEVRVRNQQAISGDADGNGKVEFADFLALSSSFGGQGTWLEGDFTGDGEVAFADFLELSDSFGTEVAASSVASVPAPSANLLCLMG